MLITVDRVEGIRHSKTYAKYRSLSLSTCPLKWNTLPFRGYQSTSLPGFVNHPGRGFVYKHIDILFKDTIDWVLLETHWTDLIQVVLSVRVGKLQPSILLRKLGRESRKNRLYQAFRGLGRVV